MVIKVFSPLNVINQLICCLLCFVLDAYKIILLHSESVSTILNRKAISKELLLKYLTDCNVPVTNNFTKTTLVEQVIEFWKRTENVVAAHGSVTNHSDAENLTTSIPKSENYPINIMSRNFSSWFYKNLNESSIQLNDFWTDCTCTIRMIDSSGEIKEDATITSRLVLNLLYTIKNQFNFFFNPNISHEGKLCQHIIKLYVLTFLILGVQGRLEIHGMVLILCCGTVHTQESAVGFFESVFGLMRDPFSDNNWKIKNIKMQMKSTSAQKIPQLDNCESLQQLMMLPENDINL